MILVDKYGNPIKDPFTHPWEPPKDIDDTKRFYWGVYPSDDGFYSFVSVPIWELGEVGFFTLDEIHQLGVEFNKIDNPDKPVSLSQAIALQDKIIEQVLTPERVAIYNKLY